MCNTNNVDKLIFMIKQRTVFNFKGETLSRQQEEDRDEQLAFMAGIDKMWMDKNPKVDFALQEPVKEAVRLAYQKMLNNNGSDFR